MQVGISDVCTVWGSGERWRADGRDSGRVGVLALGESGG